LKRVPLVFVFVVSVAMLTMSASSAVCGARDHEEGFMLRLGVGGAVAAGTEIDIGTETLKMDGTGVNFEIAIGGIITPNFAIHGTLLGWGINEPDVELTGYPTPGSLPADLILSGAGAGATYFIMPVNIYLTGTFGFSQLTVSEGSLSVNSSTGFMFEFALGKEFFVSDRWGLGFAVGVNYHSIPEEGVDENWSGVSIPVRFSATLN
jgi:hypothetical protein